MTSCSCRHCCDSLSEYLDGEIGEAECVYIEEHLHQCPICNSTFKTLAGTVQGCREAIPPEIPDEVRFKLKTFLREHCKKECT